MLNTAKALCIHGGAIANFRSQRPEPADKSTSRATLPLKIATRHILINNAVVAKAARSSAATMSTSLAESASASICQAGQTQTSINSAHSSEHSTHHPQPKNFNCHRLHRHKSPSKRWLSDGRRRGGIDTTVAENTSNDPPRCSSSCCP